VAGRQALALVRAGFGAGAKGALLSNFETPMANLIVAKKVAGARKVAVLRGQRIEDLPAGFALRGGNLTLPIQGALPRAFD
jgi:hypothetical protein